MLCPFVVVLGGMFFLATALFFLSDRAKAEQQWVTWQLQMGRYRSLFSLLNVMLVYSCPGLGPSRWRMLGCALRTSAQRSAWGCTKHRGLGRAGWASFTRFCSGGPLLLAIWPGGEHSIWGHRPLVPLREHATAQPICGEGLLCAGTGGLLGDEQEILCRAWWSTLGPQSHLSPLCPAHYLQYAGISGKKEESCVWGHTCSRVAVIKIVFPSPLLRLVKKKLLFFSKETDSDHLTVGNYSNSEDASTWHTNVWG